MTLNNYMQRFVYDVDFAKPEKRRVNEFIGAGNSLNNLESVYKIVISQKAIFRVSKKI
jgi:hypothetical protein